MRVERQYVVTRSPSGRLSQTTDFVGAPNKQDVVWRSRNTFWGDESLEIQLTLTSEVMLALAHCQRSA